MGEPEDAGALPSQHLPAEQRGDVGERIATIADEAFGPFPVQSTEENLTAIERGIFGLRQRLDFLWRRASAEALSDYSAFLSALPGGQVEGKEPKSESDPATRPHGGRETDPTTPPESGPTSKE